MSILWIRFWSLNLHFDLASDHHYKRLIYLNFKLALLLQYQNIWGVRDFGQPPDYHQWQFRIIFGNGPGHFLALALELIIIIGNGSTISLGYRNTSYPYHYNNRNLTMLPIINSANTCTCCIHEFLHLQTQFWWLFSFMIWCLLALRLERGFFINQFRSQIALFYYFGKSS